MLYGTKDSPQKRAVSSNSNVWNSSPKVKDADTATDTSTSTSSPSTPSAESSPSIGSSSLLDQRNKKAKLQSASSADDQPTSVQASADSTVNDPLLFSNGLNYFNRKNATFWDDAVNGHSTSGKSHHHQIQEHHEHQKHASGNQAANSNAPVEHNSHLIDLKYFQTKI